MTATGFAEILEITLRSLWYAFAATVLAMAFGFPIGATLARNVSTFSRILAAVFGAAAAMPTVVIGLLTFWLLSRVGPLGKLRWLYTSTGVIFGEFFLGFPIVVTHLYTSMRRADTTFYETLTTFGATYLQRTYALIREFSVPLAGAFTLSFGRIVGEVGIAMMLGGNIRHVTRTMTTTIAFESTKGEWMNAVYLGIILMLIAICINIFIIFFQKIEK